MEYLAYNAAANKLYNGSNTMQNNNKSSYNVNNLLRTLKAQIKILFVKYIKIINRLKLRMQT